MRVHGKAFVHIFLETLLLGCCLNPVLRPTLKQNFLTLLCVFALLAAQVFGGITGYLCRCSGGELLTLTDHCHGPHSEACHTSTDDSDEKDRTALSPSHDESNDGDREDHTPVRQSLELLQSVGVGAPELVAVLVEILSQPDFTVLLGRELSFTGLLREVYFAQSPGVVLRRTVALLV